MLMSTARDFIRTDSLEEYRRLIFGLIDGTRSEKGNISYTLYEDTEHAGEFVIIERWESKAALEEHFRTPHFTEIVPKIQLLQTKPSEVNVYAEVY